MIRQSEDSTEGQTPNKRRRIRHNESRFRGVVIWDIDDTLIIALNSAMLRLAKGEGGLNTDRTLIPKVEEYLFDFLDNDLHFAEVDHFKPVEHIREWDNYSLESIQESTEGRIRTNFNPRSYAKLLREKYHTSRSLCESPTSDFPVDTKEQLLIDSANPSIGAVWIDPEKSKRWKQCVEDLEVVSGGWTEKAKTVLRHLTSHGCRNMIVTASEIIPAYAKLILWELSEFFEFEDIYSSVHRSKSEIFLKILEDLGRSKNFPESMASCGDGPDEETAARTFSIPFQRIQNAVDLYMVPGLLGADLALEIPVRDSSGVIETKLEFEMTTSSSSNLPSAPATDLAPPDSLPIIEDFGSSSDQIPDHPS